MNMKEWVLVVLFGRCFKQPAVIRRKTIGWKFSSSYVEKKHPDAICEWLDFQMQP